MASAWPRLPTGLKRSAGISSYSSAAHSLCWPTYSQDSAAELGWARPETGLFSIPARLPHGFAWPQCGLVCTTDVHRAPAEERYTEALVLDWHDNKTWLQPVEAVWGKLAGRTYKYTSTSDLIRQQPPCQCLCHWNWSCCRAWGCWEAAARGSEDSPRMDELMFAPADKCRCIHMIAWLHASKWLFPRVWMSSRVTLRVKDMCGQTTTTACDFTD